MLMVISVKNFTRGEQVRVLQAPLWSTIEEEEL